MSVLEVKDLSKRFLMKNSNPFSSKRYVHAVRNVNLLVGKKEIVGLVGESGCGKTTLGRSLLRLIEPDVGKVMIDNQNILDLEQEELRKVRKKIQMIFQDPVGSLNPRMRVHSIVSEGLKIEGLNPLDINQKCEEVLDSVGLSKDVMNRYPHEFSGGQRQRIGIARALSMEPQIIVADEPVSALDVSIQSQIVNLLLDIREKRDLSILFISHDLRIIEYISDRIAVMYLGEIIEIIPSENVEKNALHPYTKFLLSAVPDHIKKKEKTTWKGELPSPIDLPKGCSFRSRCPMAVDKCKIINPSLEEKGINHWVSCHEV